MFSLRRPSAEHLAATLSAARSEQPTYDGTGATAGGGNLPTGYRAAVVRRHVGSGQPVFDAAVAAVDSWAAQRHAGVEVYPPQARPAEGETVVQLLRLGPLWATAACRIVYRLDEADRAGFAYGTLTGHPVRGEEAFLVERDAAGVVRVRIAVFSRPNHWLVRLGGPVGRLVQRRTAGRYADGIARAAR
ncbi:MAG: DUF1990 domain-containing protein [Geodermatophilaceae bacterium]|nr:DUF1990 domain-containing protein [Geodermatophilaceae bacterium]